MKRHLPPWLLLVVLLPTRLAAIVPIVIYDAALSVNSVPVDDADGAKLTAIANAAAAYWASIIKDNQAVTFTVYYDNNLGDMGTLARANVTAEAGGKPTAVRIRWRGNPSLPWYYDQTPDDHSEYAMAELLYRDLSPQDASVYAPHPILLTSVPAVFENSYEGDVTLGAPPEAAAGPDAFSIMLHEMGHGLGMAGGLASADIELNDNGFYDISPGFTNGNAFLIAPATPGEHHLGCRSSLMRSGLGSGRRRLPSAADVLAIATCPDPGWSVIDLPRKDFFPGGTTNWNTASNWVGNRVPDSLDQASVRHGTGLVNILVGLSGNAFCQDFLLSGATSLRTNASKLDVSRTVTVEFDGVQPGRPKIYVEASGELEAADVVVNGGEVDLSGGLVDASGDLTLSDNTLGNQGILSGYGTVTVEGRLVNDGRIDATDGNTLVFQSSAANPWDLDGGSAGAEVLAVQGNLNFASGALRDPFGGFMQIEGLRTITFGEPWSLTGGELQMNGGGGNTATLAGAQLTATTGADIDATGLARITAPVAIHSGVGVTVAADSQLLLNGSHSLNGGTYTGLGMLRFNGATTIGGTVVINCGILDFDGAGNPIKLVHVNADLTINSLQLDATDSKFDSTLNINGAATTLTINGPPAWIMAGVLNHTGGPSYLPSIAGVPFTMSGTTEVNASTRWDARATITGSIDLPGAADRLALGGGDALVPNRIQGGTVTGAGTLLVSATHLTGHGSIASKLDFADDSALLAEDGVLAFSGAFLSVPPLIGTKAADGTLDVTNPWTLPDTSSLGLNGGFVQGATLTSAGTISGHGEIRTNSLVNNGTLAADNGQTLVINTTLDPDLDGSGSDAQVASHTLDAIAGDLQVTKPPLDPLRNTLNIAPGRTMTFASGWALETSGLLQMTGNTAANPALLAGAGSTFRGTVNLDDYVRITSPTLFASGSLTSLADADTTLRLDGGGLIAKGAVFAGPGRVIIASGSALTLANGAVAGVAMTNENGTLELGSGPAVANVASYTQTDMATMAVEIFGRPNTGDWDQLIVDGSAQLSGRLEVVFDMDVIQAGDTWKVVSVPLLSGGFSEFSVAGVPPGYQLLKIQAATGVYLKLSRSLSYADWAEAEDLGPGNDAIDDDPDGDLIGNGLEMFLGSEPLEAEFGLLPQASVTHIDGIDYLSLTLPIDARNSPTDLLLAVTRSTDLLSWSPANVVVESVGFDELACVELKRFRSTFPYGTPPSEFLRVEVTRVVP